MPTFIHSTEDQLGFRLRELYRDAEGERAVMIARWFVTRTNDEIRRWFMSDMPNQIRGRMNTAIARGNTLRSQRGE